MHLSKTSNFDLKGQLPQNASAKIFHGQIEKYR